MRRVSLQVLILVISLLNHSCSRTGPAQESGGLINGYDVNLSSLEISSGTLSPPFSQTCTAYNADLRQNDSSVAIKPVSSDGAAQLAINGKKIDSGCKSNPVTVDEGRTAIAEIVVTAPDGITKKKYGIVFYRLGPVDQ